MLLLGTMLGVSDSHDPFLALKVRKRFQFLLLEEFLGWPEEDSDMLVRLLPHTASLCGPLCEEES